jgi:hypothetical protein
MSGRRYHCATQCQPLRRRMAAPSRSSSSVVRKRSRRSSGKFLDLSCWIAVFGHQAASLGESIKAAHDSEEAIGLARSITDLPL